MNSRGKNIVWVWIDLIEFCIFWQLLSKTVAAFKKLSWSNSNRDADWGLEGGIVDTRREEAEIVRLRDAEMRKGLMGKLLVQQEATLWQEMGAQKVSCEHLAHCGVFCVFSVWIFLH